MKKSFIAAAIIGFAALGTANASEMSQDMNFMTDHEMHDVTGARLAKKFTTAAAMRIVLNKALEHELKGHQKNALVKFARVLINSRVVYTRARFARIIEDTIQLSQSLPGRFTPGNTH